jgi:hypothetical protein
MFKKHALQVKMVKTPKNDNTVSGTTVGHLHIEPEDINKIAKDQIRNLAFVTVASVAAMKVVTTACVIAINYAPKN